MKHSYVLNCDCTRCTKERARRSVQSHVDPIRLRAREHKHAQQMHKWAVTYDALNGAPENEEDR